MKDINELHELMAELLDGNDGEGTAVFTDRGREIINEISDYAEKTAIYQENKERGEMFKDATAEQIYGYMLNRIVNVLNRIVNVPTPFYIMASVLLIMPFLRKKINEVER